jgi:hypothetical protein
MKLSRNPHGQRRNILLTRRKHKLRDLGHLEGMLEDDLGTVYQFITGE